MNPVSLVSWNVNGMRAAARKGWIEWLDVRRPDVLAVQEVRAWPEQLDDEILHPFDYNSFFACSEKKGYSGVGIYCRSEPTEVVIGLGDEKFDREGRTITVRFKDFTLINAYFPNGQRDHARVPYKLSYCAAFLNYCEELRANGELVVMCGDFNTAHREIDLARPNSNHNTTGFLPNERLWIDELLQANYIDVFRHVHGDLGDSFTWWSNRKGVRERNIGWRIDYHFICKELLPAVQSVGHLPEVMGSDHCPIFLDLG